MFLPKLFSGVLSGATLFVGVTLQGYITLLYLCSQLCLFLCNLFVQPCVSVQSCFLGATCMA